MGVACGDLSERSPARLPLQLWWHACRVRGTNQIAADTAAAQQIKV